MKKYLVTTAILLTVGSITGCGNSGMGTSTTSPASISGKVADGYLVGATVFLDKNGNYQLDPGEPSATTKDDGSYTLNMDPADVGKYPIVAMAIKDVTIDKDTNTAVANTYVLSMPATAVTGTVNSNFISPMSSQLRLLMDTGKYATMTDAMNDLSTKLGMPAGTNMMTDYMAANNANNTTMHNAARNMASLMGSQMGQVLRTSGTSTSVDVGRYQGMMVAMFKNMSSIRGSSPNSPAMTTMMGTMTTTLQGTPSGLPFRNISTAIRGMMGRTGSSTIGGMMGGAGSAAGGGMM